MVHIFCLNNDKESSVNVESIVLKEIKAADITNRKYIWMVTDSTNIMK